MSAASRAREKARILKLVEERYGPFPDPSSTPPTLEEQDPELAKQIQWYIQHRQEIRNEFDANFIEISDSDGRRVWHRPI
jgi:hypothetical protein